VRAAGCGWDKKPNGVQSQAFECIGKLLSGRCGVVWKPNG
jgi:hypothetical protein